MNKAHTKIYDLSLFIFRRDLRLDDNKGLLHSLRLSTKVLPCFIFDTVQIDSSKNSYFSHNCVQFMIESLKDLNDSLKKHNSRLFFFHGEVNKILEQIFKEVKPNAVFLNEDVTPYAIKRDSAIRDLCNKDSIKFYSFSDMMLLPKEKVKLGNGNFYQKFTPYYNAAQCFEIEKPVNNEFNNYVSGKIHYKFEYSDSDIDKFYVENPDIEIHGGRKNALKILEDIKAFSKYAETRNFPRLPSTKLSAYNKFGCASIREVYHAVKTELGKGCELVKQLYWRDFYYNIIFYYPHVIGDAMKKQYSGIVWNTNQDQFQKWKEGNTGCPIVDAGMRHLKKTGFMPNRLRMVVANYLIKDLMIDWREGEKYFASRLVDYDPAQNNGGWQWASGTGTDSQPYFRIFNPKLQSEKFDKDAQYIKKWIPELKKVEAKSIHNWEVDYKNHKSVTGYPGPLVKHDEQKKKCLAMYKKYLYGDAGPENGADENEDEEEEETPKKKAVKRKANGEETNDREKKTVKRNGHGEKSQASITTYTKKK